MDDIIEDESTKRLTRLAVAKAIRVVAEARLPTETETHSEFHLITKVVQEVEHDLQAWIVQPRVPLVLSFGTPNSLAKSMHEGGCRMTRPETSEMPFDYTLEEQWSFTYTRNVLPEAMENQLASFAKELILLMRSLASMSRVLPAAYRQPNSMHYLLSHSSRQLQFGGPVSQVAFGDVRTGPGILSVSVLYSSELPAAGALNGPALLPKQISPVPASHAQNVQGGSGRSRSKSIAAVATRSPTLSSLPSPGDSLSPSIAGMSAPSGLLTGKLAADVDGDGLRVGSGGLIKVPSNDRLGSGDDGFGTPASNSSAAGSLNSTSNSTARRRFSLPASVSVRVQSQQLPLDEPAKISHPTVHQNVVELSKGSPALHSVGTQRASLSVSPDMPPDLLLSHSSSKQQNISVPGTGLRTAPFRASAHSSAQANNASSASPPLSSSVETGTRASSGPIAIVAPPGQRHASITRTSPASVGGNQHEHSTAGMFSSGSGPVVVATGHHHIASASTVGRPPRPQPSFGHVGSQARSYQPQSASLALYSDVDGTVPVSKSFGNDDILPTLASAQGRQLAVRISHLESLEDMVRHPPELDLLRPSSLDPFRDEQSMQDVLSKFHEYIALGHGLDSARDQLLLQTGQQ